MSSETIIPFSLNKYGDDLELRYALEANWSINLSFETEDYLKGMEVSRAASSGKVDFEIHLKHTYLSTEEIVSTDKLFVGCVEDRQKETLVPLYLPFSGKFEGHLILYEASETIGKYNAMTHLNLPSAFGHLSDDLLIMFNNPDFFPDATFVCGNTTFLVHKGILSARSPVFATKFSTKMLENPSVVKIDDIKANALEFILRYIYSGKSDQLTADIAEDLLFAIKKYELQELKVICVRKLKLKTTVENVSRMFVLGYLHDESLKTYAEKFICQHDKFSEIENTQDWKMLEKDDRLQDQALEITKSVLKYKEERGWEFCTNCAS